MLMLFKNNSRRFWVTAIMILAVILSGATIKALTYNTKLMKEINPELIEISNQDKLPSFSGATGWLNSQPLMSNSLRGKVVVVNFWTYTCINWMRSLPYVRAWNEKYKEQGLVVIGVHTPEFLFEKNADNVRLAAKDLNVGYPVAMDNDYAIWQAFNNQYWPATYIVDAKGNIRHHQFGEGNYDESEKMIQKLLTEAGVKDVNHELVSVKAQGAEAAADWNNLQSAENYLGYERTENFVSASGAILDKSKVYTVPAKLKLNQWSLSGDWTVKKPSIVLNKSNGRIVYRFHARDLHIVMGPAIAGSSVKFRVLIDGKTPGASHGVDVDGDGNGIIKEQRMYQLIRQAGTITDRQFEIEFLDSGAEAFSFTFG